MFPSCDVAQVQLRVVFVVVVCRYWFVVPGIFIQKYIVLYAREELANNSTSVGK